MTSAEKVETNSIPEPQKILLVDDDVELTNLVSQFLLKNGYQVRAIHDGERALEQVDSYLPDLIVLDLMLPGTDGLTICRQIRPEFHGPIIMLTALNDDIDEVTGLEVGADDYLAKPVKPRVLLAHIRAQLRRHTNLSQPLEHRSTLICAGKLRIDERKREVCYDNKPISLSNAEYDLLLALAQCAGEIISRDELHKEIFKLEFDGFDRSIDIRISRLRKKLGDDPREPQLIKTIRNKGYLLAN